MNDGYLLDTNVVIRFLNGQLPVRNRVAETESVFLSAIVVGELLYGAEKAARKAAQISRIEGFLNSIEVLPCTIEVARRYGQISASLRAKGKPIPQNDAWIAATALAHGLTLVTEDRHFDWIEGLTCDAW